jgi:protein arginine N-methyltransferase 1
VSASTLWEHHGYLQDDRRNRAYATALGAVVEPGMRVLDLGCGSGVLGLMALAAGAAHVDAVDSSPMLEVAREIAEANGRGDQADHHQVWSTSLELPEPIDLIICDQADGVFGVQCGLLDALADARDRLARPGAVLVPATVTPLLIPVQVPTLRARLDSMGQSSNGLDTGPMDLHSRSTPWYVDDDKIEASGDELAGTPIDLRGSAGGVIAVAGELSPPPAGASWDGVLCGFRVELAPGVACSNAPGAADVIDRGGPIVPFMAGEAPSAVDVRLYPKSGILRWNLTTAEGRIERSSLDGLLDAALQARLDPSRTPKATEQGMNALAVLQAADGSRSAGELRASLPEPQQGVLDSLLSDGYLA